VTDQEVGVLAIGAGPANLALAVALEECGDQALAEDPLVLEQHGQLLDEMHLTNYGGLTPPFLDELYWMLYRQKVPGPQRSAVRPMTEVVGARIDGDEVVLDLRDRRSGKVERLHCDLVFEGAWCGLRPGTASTAHSHHEYEIFIAMAGQSTLMVDDQQYEFAAGDIAQLTAGCTHHVVNEGSADFEFYAIWWDSDMSARSAAHHDQESPR